MRGFSVVALENPKDSANVGGAIRAARCYGAAMVVMDGDRVAKVKHPAAVKGYRHVPVIQTDDLFGVLPFDCVPVAVEVFDDTTMLQDFEHPERAFYIFGPEDGGLSRRTIQRCRAVVTVPTRDCMNLAATVNVVLYDRMAKQSLAG